MLRIDLHIHSTFSDGFLPPDDIALILKKRGVLVAALTDHDTVSGVERFLARCRGFSIRGVAGVELSAAYDGVMHVLGYRFDARNGPLLKALSQNRKARETRNALICEKLRELGFDITLEEASKRAASDVVGRPHIARLMWDKGYVPSVKTAFERYLKRGAKAYVRRPLLLPEECVRLVAEAGGFPVLAHPRQTAPNLDDLPPVLSRLKDAGLWGLECWFPGNDAKGVYRCLELASAFGLCPTAGSDFHGTGHSSGVGISVREDLLSWAHLCGGL